MIARMRAFAPATALAVAATTYSVQQVRRSFHAQTGLRLVRVASASGPELTTLATRPERTKRFGRFELSCYGRRQPPR